MSKRILITGGAGFIGHHVVEHLLKHTDWEIIILDRLSYSSSGLDRLRDINVMQQLNEPGHRVKLFTADFTQPIVDGLADEIGQVDYILHMGAETHVDNSIDDPEPFVRSNVLGTMHVLNFARTLVTGRPTISMLNEGVRTLKAFVYFSTDEVFGPAPEGTAFKEWDRYNSGNPYAAAKAGGEELALAYANTYKLPVIITHTMNVFGERQHPEKFIPLVINKVWKGEKVMIHANKDKTKAGSRFWIHARNVAAAVLFLLDKAPGVINGYSEKFNIVGEREVDNLEMAQTIADILGRDLKYEMVDFHSSRPGHDLRYALDGSKMESMGWTIPVDFEKSLEKTIKWFVNNDNWLNI